MIFIEYDKISRKLISNIRRMTTTVDLLQTIIKGELY